MKKTVKSLKKHKKKLEGSLENKHTPALKEQGRCKDDAVDALIDSYQVDNRTFI